MIERNTESLQGKVIDFAEVASLIRKRAMREPRLQVSIPKITEKLSANRGGPPLPELRFVPVGSMPPRPRTVRGWLGSWVVRMTRRMLFWYTLQIQAWQEAVSENVRAQHQFLRNISADQAVLAGLLEELTTELAGVQSDVCDRWEMVDDMERRVAALSKWREGTRDFSLEDTLTQLDGVRQKSLKVGKRVDKLNRFLRHEMRERAKKTKKKR